MNINDELISLQEIAEINFLMSFKEVKPDLITRKITDDTNHIAWIIGHCVTVFDLYLSMYTDKPLLSKDERKYYAYGVAKDKIKDYQLPFVKLIDAHLEITDKLFKILKKLDAKKLEEIPHEQAKEKLSDMLKRSALHIMGHTGQIVLLRRIFDDPFWSFTGGVAKENREKLRKEWLEWWKETKTLYQ